jgi:hypothetical protein
MLVDKGATGGLRKEAFTGSLQPSPREAGPVDALFFGLDFDAGCHGVEGRRRQPAKSRRARVSRAPTTVTVETEVEWKGRRRRPEGVALHWNLRRRAKGLRPGKAGAELRGRRGGILVQTRGSLSAENMSKADPSASGGGRPQPEGRDDNQGRWSVSVKGRDESYGHRSASVTRRDDNHGPRSASEKRLG